MRELIRFATHRAQELVDITEAVQAMVEHSGIADGVTLYNMGGITIGPRCVVSQGAHLAGVTLAWLRNLPGLPRASATRLRHLRSRSKRSRSTPCQSSTSAFALRVVPARGSTSTTGRSPRITSHDRGLRETTGRSPPLRESRSWSSSWCTRFSAARWSSVARSPKVLRRS